MAFCSVLSARKDGYYIFADVRRLDHSVGLCFVSRARANAIFMEISLISTMNKFLFC